MSLFQVRKANLVDLPEIQNCFLEAIAILTKENYSLQEQQAWQKSVENESRWQDAILEQEFFLFKKENELAAFISLKEKNYIDFIYVHPNYSRQGLGTQMLQHCISKAKASKQKLLYSDVSKTARPLFGKTGLYCPARESKQKRRSYSHQLFHEIGALIFIVSLKKISILHR